MKFIFIFLFIFGGFFPIIGRAGEQEKAPPPEAMEPAQTKAATASGMAVEIQQAIDSGDADKALKFINQALVKSGNAWDKATIQALRGLLHHRMAEPGKALEDLDSAVKMAPENPAPYQVRGLVAYESGDTGSAIPDIDKAIALGATNPKTFTLRGNIYLERNDKYHALGMFQKALELDANYLEALFQRGYVYSTFGMLDQAQEDFTAVINEMPKIALTYNSRGVVQAQAGHIQQSFDDFKSAVEVDPKYGAAYSNLGYTAFLLGDTQAAFDNYDRADALDKNNAYCLCNRVELYFQLGKKIKTRGALKKCLKAAADDPIFQTEEAYYVQTLKHLKKLLDKGQEPPGFDVLVKQGDSSLEAGNRLPAFIAFSLAYMLKPDDPDIAFHIGALGERFGVSNYAITFLNRSLVLAPDGPHAAEAKKILTSMSPDIEAFKSFIYDKRPIFYK